MAPNETINEDDDPLQKSEMKLHLYEVIDTFEESLK